MYILSFKSLGSGKVFLNKFSKDALNVWKSDSKDIYNVEKISLKKYKVNLKKRNIYTNK